MKTTPARRLALAALRALRRGDLLDRAAAVALGDAAPRDRPWLHELLFGTVRLRGRLDWLLDRVVRRGVANVEADLLDVLRLGAYQLLEMGGVPAYAAISQSVELARESVGARAAGFVNGVLNALERGRGTFVFPAFEEDPVAHLATWGSHPRWLVERWIGRWGAEEARRLVELDNRRPETCLRLVGVDRASALARLADVGIQATPIEGLPHALRLEPAADPRRALAAVPAIVQDPAAMRVAAHAAFAAEGPVADLCAAPGGKAVALAAEAPRLVVALDASPLRMQRVAENARRLGGAIAGRIAPVIADARAIPLAPTRAVLVDAPCTGTGTLRRHPDGKWRLAPADLASLVSLQREILDAAAERVAPGGVLVYATCSLEPEENERQVEAFLQRHEAFRAADDAPLVVTPQGFGFDGAFAARLRRSDD